LRSRGMSIGFDPLVVNRQLKSHAEKEIPPFAERGRELLPGGAPARIEQLAVAGLRPMAQIMTV